MASARVVVSNTSDETPAVGGVFEGLSFFLIQRLPSRSTFVQRIQANGGRIVKLETQADHVIADHLRRDSPAGSLSYTFIDRAINDGELPDHSDHRAGPSQGTVREAGSAIAPKGTRTPFTQEDDRVLWQWVQRGIQKGVHEKGNELYKELEKVNPRHTYQSWRDRYVKILLHKPPLGAEVTVPANAPPSPPTAQDQQDDVREEPAGRPSRAAEPEVLADAGEEPQQSNDSLDASREHESAETFTEEEKQLLLQEGNDIIRIHRSRERDAWRSWAKEYPEHSANDWQNFWHEVVCPMYLALREESSGNEVGQPGPSPQPCTPSLSQARSPSPTTRKRTRDGEPVQSSQKKSRVIVEQTTHTQSRDPDHISVGRNTEVLASNPVSTQVIEILTNDESQEKVMAAIAKTSRYANVNGQSGGDLLTEENLASQQAEHRAQLLRGADLPEDDDGKDGEQQDAFRRMLQDVTKTPSSAQPQSLREDILAPPLAYSQLIDHAQESRGPLLDTGILDPDRIGEFVPSQQEIDDVFEANINWPESPKVAQRGVLSQPLQFETQIDYPSLPNQHADGPQEEDDSTQPNQPLMGLSVSYPSLPEVQTKAVVSRPAGPDGSDQRRPNEGESSWVEVEVEDEIRSKLGSEDSSFADEIDLSIPEPEGGWNTSSPAKLALSQLDGAQPSKGFRMTIPDHDEEDKRRLVSRSKAERPYEISSDTSSSSPSSSERAESITDARAATRQLRTVTETQDILNAETQEPDLAMRLPSDSEESTREELEQRGATPASGGRAWTRSEDEVLLHGVQTGMSSTEIARSLRSNRSPNAVRNRHALLFKQNPDIHSPRPNDSDESKASSPNQLPSDPLDLPPSPPAPHRPIPQRNPPESQLLSDGGEAYEAYFIKKTEIEKYSAADVNEALRRTSMRDDLADFVLLEQKMGRGLPSDVPGIWSVEEDRICEGGDAKAMRRVEEKHGWDELEARMEFLQELRG